MKHIHESIIGRRGSVPSLNIPRNPEHLEYVKSYNTRHKQVAEFNIEIPKIKQKGIDDVTDFIWSMVFEDRKKVANPTQWIMKNMGLDNSGLILDVNIRFLSKRSSGIQINSWSSKAVLSDTLDNYVRNNIYKIVCEFDGEYGLDDIALLVKYRYYRGSMSSIEIFLN